MKSLPELSRVYVDGCDEGTLRLFPKSCVQAAWIDGYEAGIKSASARIAELEREVSAGNECIEDVCCGATLECVKCGKPRPCLCMDGGAKQ